MFVSIFQEFWWEYMINMNDFIFLKQKKRLPNRDPGVLNNGQKTFIYGLLARLFDSNCTSDSHTDHRVVTCADETHHFDVKSVFDGFSGGKSLYFQPIFRWYIRVKHIIWMCSCLHYTPHSYKLSRSFIFFVHRIKQELTSLKQHWTIFYHLWMYKRTQSYKLRILSRYCLNASAAGAGEMIFTLLPRPHNQP